MIHYHGGPISPERAAFQVWKGRHAFISFAYPDQVGIASECTQSFALDNGAFTFWKSKTPVNWREFYDWCERWLYHPGCDFAIIPDVIEGGPEANDKLLKQWPFGIKGVPVWHLDEPIERFQELAQFWPRVALGSSGSFDVSTPRRCIKRIRAALQKTFPDGVLKTKLHGMRMLNPEIFTSIPLSSADSTTVARNIGLDVHWNKGAPISKGVRGLVLVDRIEHYNSPGSLPESIGDVEGFGL